MVASQGLLQLGMSSFLAILLFAIFGYEYELPLVMNVLLVPLIVALGYLFALGLHVSIGLDMLAAMVVEFIMLLGAMTGFHLLTS